MREISFFKAQTDAKEEEALLEALNDNEGKFVNSFENDIKKYFSVDDRGVYTPIYRFV